MTRGVIVAGAGPVGLMLAGELRLGGADVVVYDKLPAPSGESRGVGFTRRAAEVFDQRGLLARFGEVEWAQGHFGGVRIDFGMLEENHFSVRGIPQFRTEEMLEAWLAELGVTVRRSHEVVGLRQDGDGVTVRLDGPAGPGEETAEYLVGCDGGGSAVRRLAGIDFPGLDATRGMLMADLVGAQVRHRPIGERVPGGMVMAMNLEGGVTRIVIHEDGISPLHRKGSLTFADVADAWERMTGESVHGERHRWVSSFTNATRQAAEYRRGRVFLAGDAAHVHLPAGAQGLGFGVQDAVNLGWKLAATLDGWAPDGLLDTYHTERHPAGERLLLNTRAQALLYLGDDAIKPLREVLGELVAFPDAAAHLAGLVSGLDICYDVGETGHPLLGRRLPPDLEFETVGGNRVRAAELLHEAHGVLLDTGAPAEAGRAAAAWAGRVDVVAGQWSATGPPAAVLVRPDGYVVWTSSTGSGPEAALRRWFGPARVAATTR